MRCNQYLDGHNGFEDFDQESSDKIESQFNVNPRDTFFITIRNARYKINLINRTQQNIKTKTVRLIRRYTAEDDGCLRPERSRNFFENQQRQLQHNPYPNPSYSPSSAVLETKFVFLPSSLISPV